MDKKALYEKVRGYARTVGMFSVPMIMREFSIDYAAARGVIDTLVEHERAEYRDGIMFEYVGPDRIAATEKSAEDYVKALESKGDALDPLFCDALVKCAKAGKASGSIVQVELNIHYPRAQKIAELMLELGFCAPAAESQPMPMLVSVGEAEDIVGKYRLSRIVIADDRPSLWSESELHAAVLVEVEHLCRRLNDNTPAEWNKHAQMLLEVAVEANDDKTLELAKAVVDYVKQSGETDDGRHKLFLEWRRQTIIEKMKYELAGITGTVGQAKAIVQNKILRLFADNPDKSNGEIVDLAKRIAQASIEAKADGFVEDKLVAEELIAATQLDFYRIRSAAKAQAASKAKSAKPVEKISAGKEQAIRALYSSYDLDISFVIDATGGMGAFLETFKANAATLHTKLCQAFLADSRPIGSLRFQIVDFADYATEGDDALHVSDFFEMPHMAFEFEHAVNHIEYEYRGGDMPENGLEAVFAAMKSEWNGNTPSMNLKRNLIVVFSDAYPLRLMERNGSIGYCAEDFPQDTATLLKIWEEAGREDKTTTSLTEKGKRLLMFVPDGADGEGHSWMELLSATGALLYKVDECSGLAYLDIDTVIDYILIACR